ncbi:MAG: rhomboid family protein [Phycisphaerales bacterium]|nr:rhomboid family protein [Phycisphaerales bacterium]
MAGIDCAVGYFGINLCRRRRPPRLIIMGIYDRDYYRDPRPRGGFGSFSMGSVTTWLIVINVTVYLLDAILYQQSLRAYGPEVFDIPARLRTFYGVPTAGPLEQWGYFSVENAVTHLQLWRFFTYQFLHANFQHLFFNMLGLYFFGPIVESYLGTRRYLAFYLLCGCSGAFFYLVLYYLGPLHSAGDKVSLVGASAGIYGVLIAGAVLAPNVTVMLMFPPIPMQLKYLAMILVGIAAYTAFTNGSNAGGQAAHLGGAGLGYLLIRHPQVLNWVAPRPKARSRARFTDWSQDPDH